MQGYAILPDGEKKWLIWIKDWDFNWQGDYVYAQPQFLPAGTRLVMHYTYDNSTNNIRNPSSPPKRVQFGLQTTDEMGELWFQALTPSPQDRQRLAKDYFYYVVDRTMNYDEIRVQRDPSNAEAHTRLGHDLIAKGRRRRGPRPSFRRHRRPGPGVSPRPATRFLARILDLTANDLPSAASRGFLEVLRLDPDNSKAYGNLGYIDSITGKPAEARAAFGKGPATRPRRFHRPRLPRPPPRRSALNPGGISDFQFPIAEYRAWRSPKDIG